MKRNHHWKNDINKKSINMKISLITTALILISIFAVGLSSGEPGSNPTPGTLSTSIEVYSDYTLTENLVFESGHGFIIMANGVTIDGQGFKITGNKDIASCMYVSETDPAADASGHGILNSGYNDVTIKNLEIENFATGIYLHGTGQNNVENNIIQDCIIHNNGLNDMGLSEFESTTHGIHMVFVRNTLITNCEIYNNEGTGTGCGAGGNGIFVFGGGGSNPHLNTISNNNIYNNAKSGVWMKRGAQYTTIDNNTISNNGKGVGITDTVRGGIALRCKSSSFNAIEQNTVENNNGDGLFIGSNNNKIDNNFITSNDKIGVNFARSDGSKNNYLYGNTICGNENYDVFNVYDDFGGGNTGDENTGDTASNYRDEGTSGNVYFSYSCGDGNNLPTAPTITGPSSNLKKNTPYDYTFIASDPNGDQLFYIIDWGDGEKEEIGPFDSNDPQTVSHSWPESDTTYVITATAKNIHGVEGPQGIMSVKTPYIFGFDLPTNLIEFINVLLHVVQSLLPQCPLL